MGYQKIECDNCGFYGKLTFKEEDCSFSVIAFCPVCSGEIENEENEDEDDFETVDRMFDE